MVSDPRSTDRRLATVLILASFSTYGYFFQGGDWSQNSRLDLALALAQDGTVVITPYVGNTSDWSRVDNHFYSNKAPGPSFLAAPFFMLADWIQLQADYQLSDFWRGNLYLWLGSVVSVASVSAVSVGVLFLLLQHLCPQQRWWNLIVAVLYGIGTLAFPFSTAWYGHQPAGALLLVAFFLLVRGQRAQSALVMLGLIGIGGLLAGAAVTSDYPLVGVVILLSGYAWSRYRRQGGACWMWFAAACLPPAALAVYNQHVTGVFYETAYRYENPALDPGDRFSRPELWKLGALLFGPDRGLFFSSPVLAAGLLAGLYAAWLRRRAECLVIVGVFLYLLGFNMMLSAWEAGATFAPRYLVGAVPFLVLLLAWTPKSLRGLTAVVGGASAVMMLVATSVSISSPEWERPFSLYYFPKIMEGRVSQNGQHALEPNADSPTPLGLPDVDRAWCSFNVGELLGLKGLTSLAPLAGIWVVAGLTLYSVACYGREQAQTT